jgi:hypothetical protein
MQPRDTVGGARDRVCERVSSRSLALRELERGGAGLGCCGLEKAGEWAGGHAGPDVACVAGVLEQMGVDVERDGDARVAEDAADLGWVEPEVDDQVAGEGVAQVVEAKRRPAVVIQPGKLGGAREDASADIAMAASRTRTADLVGAIRIFGQFPLISAGIGPENGLLARSERAPCRSATWLRRHDRQTEGRRRRSAVCVAGWLGSVSRC